MELKTYFVQDGSGNVLPETTFYLYERGTTNIITGLLDADGNPLPNPFTSDTTGLVQVSAPNGVYDLRSVREGVDYTISVQFNDVTDTLLASQDNADRAELAASSATDSE